MKPAEAGRMRRKLEALAEAIPPGRRVVPCKRDPSRRDAFAHVCWVLGMVEEGFIQEVK